LVPALDLIHLANERFKDGDGILGLLASLAKLPDASSGLVQLQRRNVVPDLPPFSSTNLSS
jgi:hypothetical protein